MCPPPSECSISVLYSVASSFQSLGKLQYFFLIGESLGKKNFSVISPLFCYYLNCIILKEKLLALVVQIVSFLFTRNVLVKADSVPSLMSFSTGMPVKLGLEGSVPPMTLFVNERCS